MVLIMMTKESSDRIPQTSKDKPIPPYYKEKIYMFVYDVEDQYPVDLIRHRESFELDNDS